MLTDDFMGDLYTAGYLQQSQSSNMNNSDFFTTSMVHYQNANEANRLLKESLRIGLPKMGDNSSFLYNRSKHDEGLSGNVEDLDSLCYMFRDTLKAFNNTEQIFNLIEKFGENCADMVDTIKTGHMKLDVSWIKCERNTWRLIYAMFKNRLVHPQVQRLTDTISESKIIENLFQTDILINEYQLVIDWLEDNAAKNKIPNILHCQDKSVGWECTLYQLQNANIPYVSTRPLVDAVDPDAPLRQNKHIHDLDKEDENKLLSQVFMEIRRGNLRNAVNMCKLYGQMWRAAVLQGWMLYNDPNYDSVEDENLPVIGNPNRDVWKLCAWKLSQSESTPLWKAIVAVFCGNLSAILPSCKSWEDALWAYVKVLVDVRVEQELRATNVKSYVDLPGEYWNFKLTLDEIFWELENNPDVAIRTEASKPERAVQRCIILNEIPELVSLLAELCEKHRRDCNILRFSAHIVLCIQLMGYEHSDVHANQVLRAYVEFLMNYKDPEIVAYYTSFLTAEDQITLYAKYMETVDDTSLRIKCLESAELFNMNIVSITQLVVKIVSEKSESKQEKADTVPELSEEDRKKISALEWIMYYPQQRGQALWQTNNLVRQFLLNNKLQAAYLAFDKVPEDSVNIIMGQYSVNDGSVSTESSGIPVKIEASVKEYLCYKAYLDAEDSFADWFNCYYQEKPTKPTCPGENIQFTEKVAYEHSLSHYQTQFEEWKASMSNRTTLVQHRLYNVLLFPDGGWLVDKYVEDKSRMEQLETLRQQCIPKMISLLHNVFSNTENYEECIKLADVIVSEDHQLYKVYSKQGLREILKKICESSICFLNANKDPWGYPDMHISKYP